MRMPDLLIDGEEKLAAGISEQKLLRKYAHYDVLAMDEWLIDPLDPDRLRLMFEPVDGRGGATSTIWGARSTPSRPTPATRRACSSGSTP